MPNPAMERLTKDSSPEQTSLAPEELGYIAGVIDGEGTIGLRGSIKGRPHWYCPHIMIGNSNLEMLKFIQKLIGGRIYTRKFPDTNNKNCYTINWQSIADVDRILRLILPLLIVKRPQAELLLAWCEVHDVHISDTDIHAFFKEGLNKLNKKGRTDDAQSSDGQTE